ncbi:MAG: patatin-like phospholipase family protein [Aquabacterium sp.]|jgi:NTE family protein|nr:MAG: patatin-like phospholipase family protein [Aquabacterium sp.]
MVAASTRTLKEPPAPRIADRPPRRQLPYDTVALVLQGGGALGAYQAGVFQGLDEGGITPNWLAGISIGALNTAIIAGNAPHLRVARLREFWETICRPAFMQPTADVVQTWVEHLGGDARKAFNAFEAWRAIIEGQRGFFIPRMPPPWLGVNMPPGSASFYDTSQLKSTLERLTDFDRINAGETRVSVGAVNVQSGNFEYFDNTAGRWKGRLRPEHFMASGALPPGFAAVEIEGEFYWDGGIVSNTPLQQVLEAGGPRHDTIAFQVDLWSARGPAPTNIWDVQERLKDIQYSSRTRAITDKLAREQKLRHLLRELLKSVPEKAKKEDEWCRYAEDWACGRQVNIIHLIYSDKDWDGLSKDYEFGPLTMRNHWASGLEDIQRALEHPQWLERLPPGQEFVTHDAHRANGTRELAPARGEPRPSEAGPAKKTAAVKRAGKTPAAKKRTSAAPAAPRTRRRSESASR